MKDKISGIFLFFAIILGNFLDTTVGEKLKTFLYNNTIAKFFIIFVIIYYTVNFTSTDIIHPTEHLKHSGIIFLLYILATRNYLTVSILSFIMIIINYTVDTYVTYHETKTKDKQKVEQFTRYSDIITWSIICMICIGFILKYLELTRKYKGYTFKEFLLFEQT